MNTQKLSIIMLFAFFLILCSTSSSIAAPLGTAFTYQARLYDDGSPASGQYDFKFQLYDADSAGNQIGSDVDKEDIELTDGYFTAELDFGENVFTGQARWLLISIRPGASTGSYTQLDPRQKVSQVPYAIHASTAGEYLSLSESIVYDSGWLNMPMRTELNIDLGTTDYDFVFPWLHTWSQVSGEILSPLMGAVNPDYAPGYISLFGSALKSLGYNYLGAFRDPGDRNNVQIQNGNVRYLGIKNNTNAAFDTGWFHCMTSQTYNWPHNLGTFPSFVMVELAEHPDGNGWRVPTMSSCNFSGSAWEQTAVVSLDSNNMALRTGNRLAYFRNSVSGHEVAPSNAYVRIQVFDWIPDYDSGWVPISTTAGNNAKWLEHNLGSIPRMVMLYVAENNTETGWVIPSMSTFTYSFNYGTVIYNVTDRWAVIKAGAASIARFFNITGTPITPTSGYIRFYAWK